VAETFIEVLGISCSYAAEPVLEGVKLSVRKGDFLGIIGPNGSGKSTLIKAISRVLKPAQGTVYLDGREVYSMSPREAARLMAVVSQMTGINFDFTVEEIVLMGRHPHAKNLRKETREDLAKVGWALEVTKTSHLRKRLITELSGGELQRVVIARALAQDTSVLLLDEPTSHLDINHQVEILDLIKELNRNQNLTVIVVLHDLNLASQYCDLLILLNRGRIHAMGKPCEVVTQKNIRNVYRSPVIIKEHPVYGCPQVTLLSKRDGHLRDRGMKIHLVCGGGVAGLLMERLVFEGFEVSAGTLNIGDADWEKARVFNLELEEAAPFSPVTEKNLESTLKLMERADVVVVASIPYGHGNLKNLVAVKRAQERGKRVILVDGTPIRERDYTGGKASAICAELIEKGAVVVDSTVELLAKLQEIEPAVRKTRSRTI